jgi:hypothetical protein
MLSGSVGMALLSGMRGSRFSRMRAMLRDGWMCDRGSGGRGRYSQRNANNKKLPDQVTELSQVTIFSQAYVRRRSAAALAPAQCPSVLFTFRR